MKSNLLILLSIGLIFGSITISYGQALQFDGVDDRVNCGNDTTLKISGNQITLEAWINATEWKDTEWNGCIITKDAFDCPGNQGYMMRIGKKDGGSGGVVANFNIGSLEVSTEWNELWTDEGAMDLATWHHVATVYDGSTMKIYIDGIESASRDASMEIGPALKQPLLIGDSPMWPGRNFNGLIDEVRVWNVARTFEQIFTNKDKELTAADNKTGLVAYYRFNFDTKDNTGVNDAVLGDTDENEDTDPTWVAKGAPITADDGAGINDENYNLGQLHQNFPNPVNGITNIPYTLDSYAFVSLKVIDITGKEMLSKVDMNQVSGEYSVDVDFTDFSKGMYFYQLVIDNKAVNSMKLIVQ